MVAHFVWLTKSKPVAGMSVLNPNAGEIDEHLVMVEWCAVFAATTLYAGAITLLETGTKAGKPLIMATAPEKKLSTLGRLAFLSGGRGAVYSRKLSGLNASWLRARMVQL